MIGCIEPHTDRDWFYRQLEPEPASDYREQSLAALDVVAAVVAFIRDADPRSVAVWGVGLALHLPVVRHLSAAAAAQQLGVKPRELLDESSRFAELLGVSSLDNDAGRRMRDTLNTALAWLLAKDCSATAVWSLTHAFGGDLEESQAATAKRLGVTRSAISRLVLEFQRSIRLPPNLAQKSEHAVASYHRTRESQLTD